MIENLMSEVVEKGTEIIQAGWPGLVFAVVFWSCTKVWKWVSAPAPETDEDRLVARINSQLNHADRWNLYDGAIRSDDEKIVVNPEYCTISVGGVGMSNVLPQKKVVQLCKTAKKIKVMLVEQKRQIRLDKAIDSLSKGQMSDSSGTPWAIPIEDIAVPLQDAPAMQAKMPPPLMNCFKEKSVPTPNQAATIHPHNIAYPNMNRS